ncbi:MAG: DUF4982 domain-containing protein [Anaerolineaceae bacterium]|nr:DUF4982 domain-containing protein [Anaerolineaceae bacterium]
MKRIPFNFDWNFAEGGTRFFMFPGQSGDPVDLPHDYIIHKERDPHCVGAASTGFYPSGEGSYTKEFELPAEWQGKTVLLNVDGAYMHSEVTLNGDKLYYQPYGYTAYNVDVTKKLRGDIINTLRVATQSIQPNTRWYAGGGLYREVHVLVGGTQYIHPWDVFITTPEVSAEQALVRAAIEVTNTEDAAVDATLTAVVKTADGAAVAKTTIRTALSASGKTACALEMSVDTPTLWDVDDPNLYTLCLTLTVDGEEADTSETIFGIRVIEIDARNGFRLNGKKLKLLGGCIHHDQTLLGACAFPRAEERKIQILKDSGYNAIRTAHNPPSSALLDACDRLGMLVLDETFDAWRSGKKSLDYHLHFEDWWQRDTRAMVLRDRNHPSIYCWSIGNEVQELLGASDGAHWTQAQADFVRSLDPTRPVTAAANGFTLPIPGKPRQRPNFDLELMGKPVMGLPRDGEDLWGEQSEPAYSHLDIGGYNYMYGRYAVDKDKYPDRVIHATETHSFHTYDYWKAMMENENCIGDFIWTAYDNLGEAGAGRVIYDPGDFRGGLMGGWPWMSCYQGDHDLDGNRRPQSYYRKVMWGKDAGIHLFSTHPSRTGKPFYGMGWHWEDVKQTWTFEDEFIGQPVKLQAYADCDEVEFILNGESQGKVKPEEFKAFIELPYQPGTVEAVAWKDGKAVASDLLKTACDPTHLILKADRAVVAADGMDLSFITVEVVDSDGVLVVDSPVEIRVSISGAGKLAGLGSGNPCTEENYGTSRQTFNGRALICVRAAREAGEIQVEVSAENLPSAAAVIHCA